MRDKYLTLKEVSYIIKTPVPYLRYLIKSHKLKAHFIGRQYLICETDLKNFIDSQGVKNER